jgi:hypothetical protein
MRNFMEAYTAVHSKEAKEELDSQRDPISEMNTARLQDNDLRELAEEVLEEVFKTSTVKEAEDIILLGWLQASWYEEEGWQDGPQLCTC